MAKAEIKRLNIEFKEIPQNKATVKELNEKLMGPTSFTYPQIFDGDHSVGGYIDLLDYTEEMVSTGAAI
jgi:glutaredoxin